MSLHKDLLVQADQLARLGPGRPKQSSLRRAVSSAYYGLFHLLTFEVSALYVVEPGLAARINRTLNHGEMKKASSMIANNNLPKALQPQGGGYDIQPEVRMVANAFVSLQQARHEADYDLSRTFRRQETLEFVQSAGKAFATWDRVRKTDDARLYLACLHLWERWNKDQR